MNRQRKRRPLLGIIQPKDPEPTILQNGAFGKIRLSGQFIEVTPDMTVGGVRINGEGQAPVYRITINGIVMCRKDVRFSFDAFMKPDEVNLMLDKKMREVNVIKGCAKCPFIVHFYGFHVDRIRDSVNIRIFMEELAFSASSLVTGIRNKGESIPEFVIGRIACSVIYALWFLKEKMQMIHRDVKPSNILIDHDGRVKVCDFGISGVLTNSLANTNVGCQPYTAPEIAEISIKATGYSVKSDIWSLGITTYELATLSVPHAGINGMELPSAINRSDAPRLDPRKYSKNLVNFVEKLLQKEKDARPHFADVKDLAFFNEHNVPFSCIGTGMGKPGDDRAERPSVGKWLDDFRFPDG